MNWKVVTGFALLGALISLVAGLAGGNPFGVILLRVLLSAFFCAVLGAGVILALRRFVPELLSRAAAPAEPAAGEVDIVIDEDIPLNGGSLLEEGRAAAAARREPAGERRLGGSTGSDEGALSAELPEGSLEAGEELPDLEAPSDAEMEADLGSLEGETTPAEPRAAEASWEPLGEDIGSLDSLSEPGQPSAADQTPGALRGPGERARGKVDQSVAGQDPADLAKAVRTFLRKDQEG